MILDTNAVSALFVGDAGLETVLAGAARHHLPTIVVGEYRYGLERSRHRAALSRLLDRLAADSVVLSVDLATARHYATIREQLRQSGTPIPENDLWIAALARQHRLAIASRDGHFDVVEGIERRAW